MKSRKLKMSYEDGIAWIALNDEPTETNAEEIAGFISVCLLADMFGVSQKLVAHDVSIFRRGVKTEKTVKRLGRTKRFLSRKEIIKVNFLYFTNQRTLTDISKLTKISVPVIERYLFKTKDAYYDTTDKWSAFDENEKVETL